jgi:multidrug transporter EmrE-like cation transporter
MRISSNFFLLGIALMLNALANVALKIGAARLPAWSEPGLVPRLVTNPYLVLGIVLFALNVLVYAATLARVNLSIAYPVMVAGSMIVVVILSVAWLREPVGAVQLSGIALLIAGIVLVTQGPAP